VSDIAAESAEVRTLLAKAGEQAESLGHDYIDTAHLLLAILADPDSRAVRLLRELGVQPDSLRERCIARAHPEVRHRAHVDEMELTARAKASLMHADANAHSHSIPTARTEDVLLGLMSDRESIAAQVMLDSGISYERLEHAVYGTAA